MFLDCCRNAECPYGQIWRQECDPQPFPKIPLCILLTWNPRQPTPHSLIPPNVQVVTALSLWGTLIPVASAEWHFTLARNVPQGAAVIRTAALVKRLTREPVPSLLFPSGPVILLRESGGTVRTQQPNADCTLAASRTWVSHLMRKLSWVAAMFQAGIVEFSQLSDSFLTDLVPW